MAALRQKRPFPCGLTYGYGLGAPFRQGLTTRGLAWAVAIPRHLKVAGPARASKSEMVIILEIKARDQADAKRLTPTARKRDG